MADEPDDIDKELKRFQLEEARTIRKAREEAEQASARAEKLEVERAHGEALEMQREEKYNNSFRGRAANLWSKFRKKAPDGEEKGKKKQTSSPTSSGGMTFPSKMVLEKGEKDIFTIVILIFAYLIWAIDLFGYFGPPYSGFTFNSRLIFDTNWMAVFTSGIVVVLIVWHIFKKMFKHQIKEFFLLFVLLGLIYSSGAEKLYELSKTNHILSISVLIVGVAVLLWIIFKDAGEGFDLITYLIMTLVASFFWTTIDWRANPKAMIHLGFIGLFCLVYLPRQVQKNFTNSNLSSIYLFTTLFLILDFFLYKIFFGYPILNQLPILLILTSFYANEYTPGWVAKFNWILMVIIAVIAIASSDLQAYNEGPTAQAKAAEGARGLLSDVSKFFTRLNKKVTHQVEGQIDYATGGYSGLVEKNQYENLGVYFANIRTGEPRFYTNEIVTLWGTIRSKTYQDMVIVNFGCYRWKNEGGDKGMVIKPSSKVVPDDPIPLFKLEEADVQCFFDPDNIRVGAFEPGPNTVTFSADYNFLTNAYLKSYFIDRETYRALIREDIDPRDEFGIKDKEPKAVFTNGPVEIGIEAGPLISVSDSYISKPRLSVSLRNRKSVEDKDKRVISTWEGRIKRIEELAILTPPGVTLEKSACNNRPFIDYTEEMCKESCTKKVKDPCYAACAGQGCDKDCDKTFNSCNDECTQLFKADDTGKKYNGYALDVVELYKNKYMDDYLNIEDERYRTFTCDINPKKGENGVLDKTPLTTRYFRVRARYNYLLENSATVEIAQAPGKISDRVNDALEAILADTTKINPNNADADLIRAIISVESKGCHCKGCGTICNPSDILSSGSSVGIMQINILPDGGHPEWKTDASAICDSSDSVSGGVPNVYDWKCNLKLGIYILNEKYSIVGGKTKHWKCGSVDQTYSSWDAALRGYNGWPSPCSQACAKNVRCADYVGEVKRRYEEIKSGQLSPETYEFMKRISEFIPREGNNVDKVSSQRARDTGGKDNSITISWIAPPDSQDLQYKIIRHTKDETEVRTYDNAGVTLNPAGEYEFTDGGVADNVPYYYEIIAYTDFGASDPVRTNDVKSLPI